MNKLVQLSLAVSAITLFAGPASAQMTMSKGAAQHKASQVQAMMPECRSMMKEFMADPVVQKRMMAIMQKHMKMHAGQASMMMPGMSDAKATQNDSASNDSSSHETHHGTAPVAPPTPSIEPLPTPSP